MDIKRAIRLKKGITQGQMAFWDGTNWTYTETSELFWDDANKRLIVGAEQFTNKWFVSSETGDDANNGTSEGTAFATINMALESVGANGCIDVLDSATYTLSSPIIIPDTITLNMPFATLKGEINLGTSSRFIAKAHSPSGSGQIMVSCIGTSGSAYTVYGMNSTGYSDIIHLKPATSGGYIVANTKHITVGSSTVGHENILVYSSAGSIGVNIATDGAKFSSDKALNYGYPADLVYGDTGYAQWYTDVVGYPITITYDIGTGTTVSIYKMKATSSGTRMPKNWTVYGQLSEGGWELLDTQADITWDAYEEKEFTIATPASYDEYKIVVASSTHETRLQIDEIGFWAGIASVGGDVMITSELLTLGYYAQGILAHDAGQRVVTNINNIYQIAGTSDAIFIDMSAGAVAHRGNIATADILWNKTGGILIWDVNFESGTQTGSADYFDIRNTDLALGTTAGQMAFWNGTTWTYSETSELFWDDTNKRVGIGTDSPSERLDIVGNDSPKIRIQNTVGSYTGLDFFSSTGFGKFELYGKHMQFASEGDLRFYYDTNKLGLHIEETNGHVGINTDAPNYGRLQVNVDLNDANTGVTLFNSGGTTARSWLSSSDVWLLTRGSTSTKGIAIDSDGKVGIGTDSPDSQVHIQGLSGYDGVLHLSASADTDGGMYITGTSDNIGVFSAGTYYDRPVSSWRAVSTEAAGFEMKDGGIKFRMNTGLTVGNTHELTDRVVFRLDANGNTKVGVGLGQNVDPVYNLHIKAATGNGYLTFYTQDTSAIAGIALGDRIKQYQGQIQYDNSDDKMKFQAYNNEILVLDGINQRVGIGTDSPSSKLQVVGDTKLGDDNTNYASFATDGELTLTGTARVYKNQWINVQGLKAPGTKPATLVDWGISCAWEFTNGTDDTICTSIRIPQDMDITVAPELKIGFASDTNTGDVVWQLEYLYLTPNEDTTASAQETLTTTTTISATADGLTIATITGMDLPSATDQLVKFRVKRLGADGADTLADDCVLIGCGMKYVSNKLGTAL